MKKNLILFFVSVSAMVFACSSKKVFIREYNGVSSYESIVDSIEASGTMMSSYRWAVFKLDNGRTDSVKYATLYKGIEATGSIQIRELDNGSYDVKIIDFDENEKR